MIINNREIQSRSSHWIIELILFSYYITVRVTDDSLTQGDAFLFVMMAVPRIYELLFFWLEVLSMLYKLIEFLIQWSKLKSPRSRYFTTRSLREFEFSAISQMQVF